MSPASMSVSTGHASQVWIISSSHKVNTLSRRIRHHSGMQAKPRRLTKRTTAIIAVAIVAIVIASGGGTYYYINYVAPHSGCTLPSGRDAIKVGFTISLTGTYNVEGTKSLAGIQAAASWINDNGGGTVQPSHVVARRFGRLDLDSRLQERLRRSQPCLNLFQQCDRLARSQPSRRQTCLSLCG